MNIKSFKFRGHRCFKDDWAGFETIKPVNVIIGKNNTGKSHLLDLVDAACEAQLCRSGWRFQCSAVLDEPSLRRKFPENSSSNAMAGDYWRNNGKHFLGLGISWEIDDQGNIKELSLSKPFVEIEPTDRRSAEVRMESIYEIVTEARTQFSGMAFRRLVADRDIRPEPDGNSLELTENGTGATNIIRRYLVSSSPRLPREVIHQALLQALNTIFGNDTLFTEIEIKQHDEAPTEHPKGTWEVFLGEKKKGLVALSRSGSGIKTMILVLLNLLVIPEIQGKTKDNYVFAFEELENNLHPALLRKLLQYLETYAIREKATIFLTTHSSVALDIFGLSKNAQIIHVTHNGVFAKAQVVSAHFDHLGVISELGAKPSDLLQANGIVWVEGPSDCIYINRWIDLFTDGALREGRDYQCAFYGGSLLARAQFASPEDAEQELVNLFRVNPNIIVVCDGDRTTASGESSRIKARVRRIHVEVRKIPNSHIWITDAKEIESYLPGVVLSKLFNIKNLPNPGKYEVFFPRDGARANSSYLEKNLNRKGIDKMDLAVQAAPYMTRALMETRFELAEQISSIISKIKSWNA